MKSVAGKPRPRKSPPSRHQQKPVKPLVLTPQLMQKFEHRLVGFKKYDTQTLPGKYAILSYKLPRAADTEDFLRGHSLRSDLQARLSARNPSIASIVLSGFDISSREFLVVIRVPPGFSALKTFPISTSNHVVFAKLERELCRLWSSGGQFMHLNPYTVLADSTGRPLFTDLSQLINMSDSWRAAQFQTFSPGKRIENAYIDLATGDAVLLRRILAKLPPLNNPAERDRALDIARQAVWNPGPADNNVGAL